MMIQLRSYFRNRFLELKQNIIGRRDPRPRVIIFIVCYPNFSETYIHEEIRALYKDYNIKIIAYRASDRPRRDPLPFKIIRYKDSCLVFQPIHKINRKFDSPNQIKFLKKIDSIIEKFKPDLLHAHYFGLGLLLQKLAERHKIPFTLRTHSMDILSEPDEKIEALCEAVNSPFCLRVITFPAFRDYLVAHGLQSDKLATCWPVVKFTRFYKPDLRSPTGRVLCASPAVVKKGQTDFIDLAKIMRGKNITFDLYAKGRHLEFTKKYNGNAGNVVNIKYADPDDMPDIYPKYDWLVYTSDVKINKVGFPVGIAEAQASGVGVCWQELPGRKEEQLEYMGNAGFLFKNVAELSPILSQPVSEEMRLSGLENARKCDIEQHINVLTDSWMNITSN